MATLIQIRFRSGYVNGFLFVFIDILGIWAIHRGLAALQAYYHFRSALLNDAEIPVKRSRIPVISGDLLAGRTRFPSIFIIVHIFVVGMAFAATLGVAGASEPKWKPLHFSHVTSLTPTGSREVYGLFGGSCFQCRVQKLSELTIWPVAFNRSKNDKVWGMQAARWRTGMGRCMRGVPKLPAMLHVKCDHRDNCDIGRALENDQTPSAELLLTTPPTKRSYDTYTVSPSSSASIIRDLRVPVNKIFTSNVTEYETYTEALIWAIGSRVKKNSTYRRYYTLSWGTMTWEKNGTNSTNKVTIRVDSFTADRPLPSSAAFYARISEYYNLFPKNRYGRRSGFEMVEYYLMASISEENARGRTAERDGKVMDVTNFRVYSMVTYVFLAVLAVILGFTKEILKFFVVPKGHKDSEVFSYDPDSLSEALGAALERRHGLRISGKMAVVRKYQDKDKKERVGLCTTIRTTGEKDTSSEGENTADKLPSDRP